VPPSFQQPLRRADRAAGILRHIVTVIGLVLLMVVSTTPLFAVADMPAASRGTLAAVFACRPVTIAPGRALLHF
jgi:hypothetical protein